MTNLTKLEFEEAQIIGKQLAELVTKIHNSSFQIPSLDLVLKSKTEKGLNEQIIKSVNEYSQRETEKRFLTKRRLGF